MRDFKVALRLETPLLLGGPWSGECDPVALLRGASIRGLLHTFTRALIGPYFPEKPGEVHRLESLLLGTAGGEDSKGPTFRLMDATRSEKEGTTRLEVKRGVPIRPGQLGKGTREGFGEDQKRILCFQPRRWVFEGYGKGDDRVKPIPYFREILWAIAWTAFSLGGLGTRSRRGYGSLTVEGGTDLPDFSDMLGSARPLPLFDAPPANEQELATMLCGGVETVFAVISKWLDGKSAADSPPFPYFQICNTRQIRVGKKSGDKKSDDKKSDDWKDAIEQVMDGCGNNKDHYLYPTVVGSARKDHRLASPLWVRIYKIDGGYVPLAIYSPRNRNDKAFDLVDDVRAKFGATPERTIEALSRVE
jgi:hypothetical protein